MYLHTYNSNDFFFEILAQIGTLILLNISKKYIRTIGIFAIDRRRSSLVQLCHVWIYILMRNILKETAPVSMAFFSPEITYINLNYI